MALAFPYRRSDRSSAREVPKSRVRATQERLDGPRALTFGALLGLASWMLILGGWFGALLLRR